MNKTFHIDGDFLQEDARMERPSYKDYDNGIGYNNAIIGYNAHIASLGRYILGDLKEWTKTTGITEDDFHPDCATMQKTACQVFKRPSPLLMTVTAPLPPPVAEEPEDLFEVAMDNDWSAKKIIAYILENYTLVKR